MLTRMRPVVLLCILAVGCNVGRAGVEGPDASIPSIFA